MKVGDTILINEQECEITLMLESYMYAESTHVHESHHCHQCGDSLVKDKHMSLDCGKTFSYLGEICSSCGSYI